ncbi:GATA transcription factor 12 [Zea mays]|uniref:GATA transcription factor 12 n=1 Tax=Zea mays TaxID=4577 RepID=A0A3L6EAS4_MAIZE|nr:GATA transcription factor 12 [Zea mays]
MAWIFRRTVGRHSDVDGAGDDEQVLLLITAWCLLGKEVRERMLDKVDQVREKITDLTSLLFQYASTPVLRQRDRVRAALASIFAEVVRSRRRSFIRVGDDDVLQSLMEARYRDGRGTTEPEYDQLAELEWLSNYLGEDNFPTEDLKKLQLITGIPPAATAMAPAPAPAAAQAQPAAGVLPQEAPVLGKARSKRSRVAPCSWASRVVVLPPPPSPGSPPSAAISPSESGSGTAALAFPARKPSKPAKKKEAPSPSPPPVPNNAAAAGAGEGRRCLHCETDKTPQWRTGPLGPKTLCNACGVRYKSGRLVPEYRPAASPTFVVSKHSNSHRKVLELQRQKEAHPHQHHHHHQYQPQQALAHVGAGGTLNLMHAPSPLLFDGPAAPLIGDDFLVHSHIGPDFRQLI